MGPKERGLGEDVWVGAPGSLLEGCEGSTAVPKLPVFVRTVSQVGNASAEGPDWGFAFSAHGRALQGTVYPETP